MTRLKADELFVEFFYPDEMLQHRATKVTKKTVVSGLLTFRLQDSFLAPVNAETESLVQKAYAARKALVEALDDLAKHVVKEAD